MTVSSVYSGVNSASSTSASNSAKTGSGLGGMGADDFLKLMLTQMQNQDPTAPMDQKDMLAQMAQFTSLSNSTEMTSTLKAIGVKLGAIDPTTGKPIDFTSTGTTINDADTSSSDGIAA
jgi:flagellar basal-body rod modification protein FlgD